MAVLYQGNGRPTSAPRPIEPQRHTQPCEARENEVQPPEGNDTVEYLDRLADRQRAVMPSGMQAAPGTRVYAVLQY
jgi:hypothetical protein